MGLQDLRPTEEARDSTTIMCLQPASQESEKWALQSKFWKKFLHHKYPWGLYCQQKKIVGEGSHQSPSKQSQTCESKFREWRQWRLWLIFGKAILCASYLLKFTLLCALVGGGLISLILQVRTLRVDNLHHLFRSQWTSLCLPNKAERQY